MVGSEGNFDSEVHTRRDDRNSDSSSIVPRLPDTQPLSGYLRRGAAIRGGCVHMTPSIVAVRAAVRAIPELLGHTFLPILIISHPLNQLDLAHRVD